MRLGNEREGVSQQRRKRNTGPTLNTGEKKREEIKIHHCGENLRAKTLLNIPTVCQPTHGIMTAWLVSSFYYHPTSPECSCHSFITCIPWIHIGPCVLPLQRQKKETWGRMKSHVLVLQGNPSKDAAHEGVSFRGSEGQSELKNCKSSSLGQVANKRSMTRDRSRWATAPKGRRQENRLRRANESEKKTLTLQLVGRNYWVRALYTEELIWRCHGGTGSNCILGIDRRATVSKAARTSPTLKRSN